MVYDEDLADRIREQLAAEPDLTERKMFGGLAFLLGGHLAITASGQGGAMVRVGPAASERLLEQGEAEPVVMRGRPMAGYVRIPIGRLRTERQLARWIDTAVAYVRSLPPKGG